MDGVRSYAGRPRHEILSGWDQSERSGTEDWRAVHEVLLQVLGEYAWYQMGTSFRGSSSAPRIPTHGSDWA